MMSLYGSSCEVKRLSLFITVRHQRAGGDMPRVEAVI